MIQAIFEYSFSQNSVVYINAYFLLENSPENIFKTQIFENFTRKSFLISQNRNGGIFEYYRNLPIVDFV